MIPYPAAIAIHLLAVILFVGGLLITAIVLRGTPDQAELRRLKRLNLFVTTPALLVVWAVGIHLALDAGWFAAFWLRAKLLCVAILSLIHAWQSYRLTHRTAGRSEGGWAARTPLLIALLIVVIFYLVGAKPV